MSNEPETPRPPPKWVTAEDIVDEFGVSSSTASVCSRCGMVRRNHKPS